MSTTVIQRVFAPVKKYTPKWLADFIRSIMTSVLAPFNFAYQTGFVRSAFKMAAVSKTGSAIPWYTYSSIDFLKFRDFENHKVLEFGGGQSTLWWAQRAAMVVTMEGGLDWYNEIKDDMPDNVELHYVSMQSREANVESVKDKLKIQGINKYDVIVIDGLYREDMIKIALQRRALDGIIICDNADGYGVYEGFKDSGLKRVDFFGNAPGVVLPHCTSIYFSDESTLFDAAYTIPKIYQHY